MVGAHVIGNGSADPTEPGGFSAVSLADVAGTATPSTASLPSRTSASTMTSSAISSTSSTTTATMPFTGDERMSISVIQSTETDLWEMADGECSSRPQTAVVSATVVVPSEVSGVVVEWGVDAPDVDLEWTEMVEPTPDVYSVTIGPFAEDTLDSGGMEPIHVATDAGDVFGNGVLADPAPFILLHDCGSG